MEEVARCTSPLSSLVSQMALVALYRLPSSMTVLETVMRRH